MTVSRDLTPIDASAEPWAVVPTQAEREAGTLSPESIARAVEGLNREGVIVLKGVVDPEHVRILRDRVLSDIEQYETDGASEKIEQGGVGWWHSRARRRRHPRRRRRMCRPGAPPGSWATGKQWARCCGVRT